MGNLERLKSRTGEADEALLNDLLESAKAVILSRRYPFWDRSRGFGNQIRGLTA